MAVSRCSGHNMSTALDQLYAARLQKLEEQKALSNRMNQLLTQPKGMNDSMKLTLKNLQAAIAVSKQPGYFEYYETPDNIKQVEQNKVLNSLARAIQKLHAELTQINEEIHTIEMKRSENKSMEMPMNSLKQWFDTYGRPKEVGNKEQITQFVPLPRVYGGTGHHRAFKSQAATMKVGRITR